MRSTSLDAYKEILPLLPKKRRDVYEAVVQYGPATANELFTSWKVRGFTTQSNLHARLGELRATQAVYEIERRQCRITGRSAIVWEITNKKPIKYKHPRKVKCAGCNGTGYIKPTE